MLVASFWQHPVQKLQQSSVRKEKKTNKRCDRRPSTQNPVGGLPISQILRSTLTGSSKTSTWRCLRAASQRKQSQGRQGSIHSPLHNRMTWWGAPCSTPWAMVITPETLIRSVGNLHKETVRKRSTCNWPSQYRKTNFGQLASGSHSSRAADIDMPSRDHWDHGCGSCLGLSRPFAKPADCKKLQRSLESRCPSFDWYALPVC